jgi:TldD protein
MEQHALKEMLTALVARAERRLEARSPAYGEPPVVFGPGVGGVLVHELIGHALEADVAQRGASWLTLSNQRVAPPELGVLDDPRRGRAAWGVDDEGEKPGPTALIVEGRVRDRLHDRRTAAREGTRPTGHGRRSSFREPVLPRMGCTFVTPGRLRPQEVREAVADGLYIRRMEAATTDPRTGRAVFRVTDADRIESGRLTAPLTPFLLRVDGASALSSAYRAASDLTFDTCIGSCHREGQPLAISVGAPTMLIGVAGVCS